MSVDDLPSTMHKVYTNIRSYYVKKSCFLGFLSIYLVFVLLEKQYKLLSYVSCVSSGC